MSSKQRVQLNQYITESSNMLSEHGPVVGIQIVYHTMVPWVSSTGVPTVPRMNVSDVDGCRMLYLHNNCIRSSWRGVCNDQGNNISSLGMLLGILIRRLEEDVSRMHDG